MQGAQEGCRPQICSDDLNGGRRETAWTMMHTPPGGAPCFQGLDSESARKDLRTSSPPGRHPPAIADASC